MAGLIAWTRSGQWQEDGGRYIPRAAKFLAEQRWKDAPRHQNRDLDEDEREAIRRMLEED